jgi:hypothetical protein
MMDRAISPRKVMQRIQNLLEDLPPESLMVIEQLLRMMNQQTSTFKRHRYPTIAAPASTLTIWTQLLPEGYEGNALEDTEALYEEA